MLGGEVLLFSGKRIEGTKTVATRTIRKGNTLTTIPVGSISAGRWSASPTTFKAPVYSNITTSKKFYYLAN